MKILRDEATPEVLAFASFYSYQYFLKFLYIYFAKSKYEFLPGLEKDSFTVSSHSCIGVKKTRIK